MIYHHQINKRICVLFSTILLFVNTIVAQQWVVDEIAEENEGGPFSGIVGALLLIGLIWLLGHLFGGKKEEKPNNRSYEAKTPADSYSDERDDDLDISYINDDIDDELNISYSAPSSYSYTPPQNSVKTPPVKKTVPLNKSSMSEEEYKNKCIEIYGDYAENTYGLVLIKEDGEYRQISYPDKRYEILSSYIYSFKRERHATVCLIGNGEQLKYYIEYSKECKLFPEAKPMETHGKLEKEYYGERIAMMMAYYDEHLKRYPIYSSHAHSLRDFCLSLGWDLAIYIHRYINQPMEWQVYHDLKEMLLRKMTKDEYLEYRSKADYITDRGKEGCFDGWGKRIGDNYGQASEELKRREVITYEQAIAEVKQMEWHL